MAQHNLNNIIVDRVLRGVFSDKNDNIIFSLNQVQNLSMNQTSESQDIVFPNPSLKQYRPYCSRQICLHSGLAILSDIYHSTEAFPLMSTF